MERLLGSFLPVNSNMADMKFILLMIGLTAVIHDSAAYCNIKRANETNCWFSLECHIDIREVALPLSCTSSNRTRLEVKLNSPSTYYQANIERVSYIGNVVIFRATGNHWRELPYYALLHMPRIEVLQISNNHLGNISSKSLENFVHLRSIDMSWNQIVAIDADAFVALPKLERLYLAKNKIKQIQDGTFDSQSVLTVLDLSQNMISLFNIRSFKGLYKLESLNLNHNDIYQLNGALKHLHNLKHLYLRGNKLHQVNIEEIPNFKNLQTLDMSNNTLSWVQPEVFSRHWVKLVNPSKSKANEHSVKIFLSGNKIALLENASFTNEAKSRHTRHNMVEVLDPLPTDIDLSYNMIETIEYDAFQGIHKLQSLDLSCNCLTDFKVNTTNLDKLLRLHLQNNLINVIFTETFHNLGCLKYMDISGNKIEHLASHSFQTLRDLTTLNLSNNLITKLDATNLDKLKSLHVLDMSNNMAKEVSISYLQFTGLKKLVLQSNNITDMALIKLDYLLHLESLDLSRNNIVTLDPASLAHIQALKHLNLSSNLVSEIKPATFFKVHELRTLDLSDNDLTRIDYGAFQGLNKLQQLDLSFNHIAHLESKVLFNLKQLEYLMLDQNGMEALDLDVFRGRSVPVKVTVGGNKLRCSWLAVTLNGVSQGWEGAWLTSLDRASGQRSVGGISCEEEQVAELNASPPVAFDDRLLLINQKILNAIQSQNSQLKKTLAKLFYFRKIN